MRVSKSPTIHLEETTLTNLEAHRQHLLTTWKKKKGVLNYDKVIALLIKQAKRQMKEEKANA
jgi:hypothetical protein